MFAHVVLNGLPGRRTHRQTDMIVVLLFIAEIVPTDLSTTTTESSSAAAETEAVSTESEADLQKSTQQAAPAKGSNLTPANIHVNMRSVSE